MKTLLQNHPTLVDVLRANPALTTYKICDDKGNVTECRERDTNGHWTNMTAIQRAREELAAAKTLLARVEQRRTTDAAH